MIIRSQVSINNEGQIWCRVIKIARWEVIAFRKNNRKQIMSNHLGIKRQGR